MSTGRDKFTQQDQHAQGAEEPPSRLKAPSPAVESSPDSVQISRIVEITVPSVLQNKARVVSSSTRTLYGIVAPQIIDYEASIRGIPIVESAPATSGSNETRAGDRSFEHPIDGALAHAVSDSLAPSVMDDETGEAEEGSDASDDEPLDRRFVPRPVFARIFVPVMGIAAVLAVVGARRLLHEGSSVRAAGASAEAQVARTLEISPKASKLSLPPHEAAAEVTLPPNPPTPVPVAASEPRAPEVIVLVPDSSPSRSSIRRDSHTNSARLAISSSPRFRSQALTETPQVDLANLTPLQQVRRLLEEGRTGQGVALARSLLRANPRDQDLYVLLAAGLQNLGRWKEASAILSQCVDKVSKEPAFECFYFAHPEQNAHAVSSEFGF